MNQQLLAATHYGVTGEIELMLPAGVAAAVERIGVEVSVRNTSAVAS